MKRLLFRSLIVLGALLAAGAAIIYWLVASSLPQLDGGITSAGLKAAVSIERDAAGIPTITARNRLDLAFASGYVHGQDRFFQMDLSRRRAAGELAQLFGEGALGFDRRTRLHRFRSRARAVIENSTEADVALLDAYAAGVNAGLDGLGARPFEYFILQSKPQPWTSEDCILVGYAMFLTLNDERARRDVQRGLAHRILPPQVYHWMYPHGTEWDAPMQGDARPHAEIPGPDVYDLRDSTRASGTAASTGPTGELPVGSNNWAVSGDLTQNGRAIVANDMHLDLATPNIVASRSMPTSC